MRMVRVRVTNPGGMAFGGQDYSEGAELSFDVDSAIGLLAMEMVVVLDPIGPDLPQSVRVMLRDSLELTPLLGEQLLQTASRAAFHALAGPSVTLKVLVDDLDRWECDGRLLIRRSGNLAHLLMALDLVRRIIGENTAASKQTEEIPS